jgi:(2Fe-2S) ferredoxin
MPADVTMMVFSFPASDYRSLMSFYKRHVFFCTNCRDNGNVCCEDHNAAEMRQYAKRRIKELNIAGQGGVRINTAGCLDRCSEGPIVVVYPDAVWYTYMNHADVDEIIDEHLLNGCIVDRLRI